MARNKGAREFWESGALNNATYLQYYRRLTELSISMFDWKGLPDSIDPRFMELTLFSEGHAIFFYDDALGYLCLQAIIGGKMNVYRIPIERTAFSVTGYQKKLNEENSVIIWNNMLHTPSKLDVKMFSNRLYELDRAIDVNAKAQKTPILIQCDEDERLSMLNLYKQYDGNSPFIFGNSKMSQNPVKSITTGAPYVADKLYTLKTQLWNEALTYLGISNINVQKKERLITDEVTRNQGGVVASRYSRLESRRQACDQINKMFGLNISCEYREDYREIDESIDTTTNEEDDSDE